MMRFADMMAQAKLVPDHLRSSPGDCLLVIEQAIRWGMSPFAVAQCTSIVKGRLNFEGKLVAAAINSANVLAGRLHYDFLADSTPGIIVSGTLRGETERRAVTVFLKDVRTTNDIWNKQPEQQLVYAGTRVWARRFVPEVMLGVYVPEEFDAPPQQPNNVIDVQSEAAQVFEQEDQLDTFQSRLASCATVEEVKAVGLTPEIKALFKSLPADKRVEMQRLAKARMAELSAHQSPTDQGA
ncbi:MAG TPA: recombinase RecT [Acidocella sp.]|nr:recombinase RecT [Acidocella sp.]